MAPRILLVDDDSGFREVYTELLSEEGYDVLQARDAPSAIEAFSDLRPDLVVLDLMLPPSGKADEGVKLCQTFTAQNPACKIVTISGTGDTALALQTLHHGAYDFIAKPIDPDCLFAILKRAEARVLLEKRVLDLEKELVSPAGGAGLLGQSKPFLDARSLCEKVAPTDVPVLITGGTGTGKEVFARYLHQRSNRSEGLFIAVNCGAFNASLLESTLFGHVKGAFTGANQDQDGLFVAAKGGTLFLDEIGDMEFALQVKLLRVLEAKEIQVVGSTQTIPVDVRIVSATHRNLSEMISEKSFRDDLYWRIRGIEIELPDLAHRSGDLEVLAQHFLNQARGLIPGAPPTKIGAEVLSRFENYAWPGNLRELRHEMQRALVMAGTRGEIWLEDLSPTLQKRESNAPPSVNITLEQKLSELERQEIENALESSSGNKSEAARQLGISRQGLMNKMARYSISLKS